MSVIYSGSSDITAADVNTAHVSGRFSNNRKSKYSKQLAVISSAANKQLVTSHWNISRLNIKLQRGDSHVAAGTDNVHCLQFF